MNFNEAKAKLEALGQSHLLRWYDELGDMEQEALLTQIEALDPSLLEVFAKYGADGEAQRGKLEPLGALTIGEIEENRERFETAGLEAIRQGKIGAVLLAGGMGTRLGFDKPKGMYNIGKTHPLYIFECLIRNLMEVVDKAGTFVPLFIMTSEKNDEDTREFFEEQKYFGYNPEYVHFFVQDMAPAVDPDGRILLEEKGRIATSPNGNGGWFSSMAKAGLLGFLQREGIEWLNIFAVDNVLQRIADPCFVGATLLSGSESGAKVVAKADPQERVGVLCLEDGAPSIVEYYEMTEEMITRREPDGRLSYNFGVILNYLFRTDRLTELLGSSLQTHVVNKKVPFIDETGSLVKPDKPNAYKFETLVLDMVHQQRSCLSYEVERDKEFAPIKNPDGVDSVVSAQALLEANGVVL
ncbi:MAG: UDPGP type 1 family protein [Oscillospiraceae bacterium]|nr:UDPGP type 1 family protein [Oscillospiraceae bacterium]MBR1897760.1 UDPGP type 1 family protein [Oscillospiraceae bacterium]